MRLVLLVLGLCSAAFAGEGENYKRQESLQCRAISNNIGPLLGPCAQSTKQCLSTGDIDSVQDLICPPTKVKRETIYDVLVECQGQNYTDIVYAGICGSTTGADGEEVQCSEAILTINDGSAAKEACCGAGEVEAVLVDVGSGSQCAEELRKLTSDVGCCTATIVFQFFFQECTEDRGLPGLLAAAQIDQPPLCTFPLYTGEDSALATGAGIIILAFTVVSSLFVLV